MTYLTALRNCLADARTSVRQALDPYLNSEDGASISVEQKAALIEELRKLRDANRPSEVFGVDQAFIEDADIQPYDQRIVRLSANLANVESILRDVVEREVFASMPDAVANIEQLRKGIGSFNQKWRGQFSFLASANDATPTTHHAVQAPTTIISFNLEQRHCAALNKLKFPDRHGKYLRRRKGKVYRHVVDRYMFATYHKYSQHSNLLRKKRCRPPRTKVRGEGICSLGFFKIVRLFKDLFAALRRKVYAVSAQCIRKAYSARDTREEIDEWLLDESELDIVEMDFSVSVDQDKATLKQSLAERLKQSEGILSKEAQKKLEKIVYNHLDAFGHTVGGCSLSELRPMKVQIKKKARPCIASARNMCAAQLKFLREKLALMEERGVVKKVHDSTWSRPGFVEPKPEKPGQFSPPRKKVRGAGISSLGFSKIVRLFKDLFAALKKYLTTQAANEVVDMILKKYYSA